MRLNMTTAITALGTAITALGVPFHSRFEPCHTQLKPEKTTAARTAGPATDDLFEWIAWISTVANWNVSYSVGPWNSQYDPYRLSWN